MAGFLYFVEGATTGTVKDVLKQRGYGYVATPGVHLRGANEGPGGVSGTVAGMRVPSREVGFFPESQTWRKSPGGGVWVGLGADKPSPSDLARREQLSGHDVTLADGNIWTVPVARWLPRTMDLDDAGRWVTGGIVDTYRGLWEAATEWLEAKFAWFEYEEEHGSFRGFDDERITDQWVYTKSCDALAANYMLGPVEAAMLGLFVTGCRWLVLDALIDQEGLSEIMRGAVDDQKKSDDLDTSSITDGSTGA